MLYQPTFPSPYLETIDVENPSGNVFKCLINPKNKVIGYKINILSNVDNTFCCALKGWIEDVDGVKKQKKAYSIDKTETTWTEFENVPDIDSELPIVGSFSDQSWLEVLLPSDVELNLSNDNDYKWNIILQEETPNIRVLTTTFYRGYEGSTACTLPKTDGVENIVKDTVMYIKYKNNIKQIAKVENEDSWKYIRLTLDSKLSSIEGDSCEILTVCLTSYDYYFKARKTPILTFDVPDTINSLTHTFTAELDKPNIAYYKFDLYLGTDLIDTSENTYSNYITYTYDGLLAGNKYSIVLTVVTEDNETIIEEKEFSVSYNISYSTIFVEAEMDKSVNGVYLDYSSQVSIDASVNNTSDIIYSKYKNNNSDIPKDNNSIHLNKGESIYWNNINNIKNLVVPNNSTTIIHWHGDLGYTGKIAELSNNEFSTEKITIGYDSKNFYYKIGTNDVVYYSPYTNGTARVIAGADDYSVGGQILNYNNEEELVQITIPFSEKVKAGMYISILGERKLITNVVSQTETIITIESDFDSEITSGQNFFVYDELRCYLFSDDDIPQDNDIFVENDMGYNYWWLIVITENEVRFIKTQRYIDTVVSE